MPPKVKIQKESIIQTALTLVRTQGEEAINARAIAAALGCSTQPVFSNFATMQELQEATLSAAYEIYLDFLKREAESGEYPKYKAFGMAYVRFAKEEKELFKLLFMCDRGGKPRESTADFEASIGMIMQANGLSRQVAELMHLECWACVHGIATMLATDFLDLDEELVSRMVSDVYQGVRKMHKEENA